MQPIKKLDTQLANQIAAGEVVERPASVVKELLENSLDAGASRIDIEITSGGCNLIRIRDDGCGIPKLELELALAPHATSKISCLNDLDVIHSFGFRGEALSSISSVSKFSIGSRTRNTEQGWQAEIQGRDMQVKLTPVALTEGTRIDVRELFYNTPARRRFLRTEKTEFSYIEDVVKKTALANFAVTLTLKHNSKMRRRFRAAHNLEQQEQRVAAVCGRQFMQRSIRLDLEHAGIELSGWLALPDYHRSQTDGQYFYVNNRPVKDRVLNHAIRQAYQNFIPEGRVPAYVLFLIIDPGKVDVNVHPTKHEVRFHDGRLIHDLLVQAIERGLSDGKELIDGEFPETIQHNRSNPVKDDIEQLTSSDDTQQHQAYRSFLQTATAQTGVLASANYQAITNTENSSFVVVQGWRFLTRLNDEFLLLEKDEQIILLSVPKLIKYSIDNNKKRNLSDKQAESDKLLFPEIIICRKQADAKQLSHFLENYDIKSTASDTRITIEVIPTWFNTLPIKSICCEIIRVFFDKSSAIDVSFLMEMSSSEQDSIALLLQLLVQCSDVSKLGFKTIPKNSIQELF